MMKELTCARDSGYRRTLVLRRRLLLRAVLGAKISDHPSTMRPVLATAVRAVTVTVPCHRDIMPCRHHVTPLLLLLSPCCSSRLIRRSSAFRVGRVLRLTCLRGGFIDADNFYEVLGVKSDAASSEIKRAYRQRSLETHPDRNKDPNAHEQFIQVGRAYETLKDPAKRASYDQTRRWRTQQREQHAEKHTDEGQYERWRPPPRS